MARQSKLEAQFLFENGDTKTIGVTPFLPTSEAVTGFKARIMESQEQLAGDITEFVASDGSKVSKVKAATITTTDATVIYAKTEAARIAALKIGGEDDENNA